MVARQNYAAGIRTWYHRNPIDAVLRAYMRSSDCFEYPNPTPSPPPLQKKKTRCKALKRYLANFLTKKILRNFKPPKIL